MGIAFLAKLHSYLFPKPVCRWNDGAFNFKRHAGQGSAGDMELHAQTFPILTSLSSQKSEAEQPIGVILENNLKGEIEQNRSKLASIAYGVLFCGRLGLLCVATVMMQNIIQKLVSILQGC